MSVERGPKELRGVKMPVRGPVIVGRSPGADIVIGASYVSARHARFSIMGQNLFVEDLGSTNGTAVNGQRIAEPVALQERRCGQYRRRHHASEVRIMAAAKKAQRRGRHAKVDFPEYGSRTDVGLIRDHNEDSLTVAPPVFAVADGMGGHAAGEVASEIAIQTLVENAPDTADGDTLARAVVEANRAVIRAAVDGRGKQGMGTTMTAAVLDGVRLVVAQVGDSRAYLLHRGNLQRITRDHSLVADMVEAGEITEEQARGIPSAASSPERLGSDPRTLPDIYEMTLEGGDRLLFVFGRPFVDD